MRLRKPEDRFLRIDDMSYIASFHQVAFAFPTAGQSVSTISTYCRIVGKAVNTISLTL
jgi:hypothetical protein